MKDPDFSYINKNKKRVTGAAAFLHTVYTECGSVAKYNEEVGKIYSEEEQKLLRERTNERMMKKIRKNRLKCL